MSDSLLPAHLRNVEHLAAFEQVWDARVSAIDISELMMYMIDTASTKALPFLAEQFGIITLRSWKLAIDDDERRQLIKDAIADRASVGTVAAVKKAVASLGFDPSHIVERSGTDPVFGWAQFKLAFSSDELAILDATLHELLEQLINDTKPARCQYMGLDYTLTPIIDTVTAPTELITIALGTTFVDTVDVSGFKHNGLHKRDGSMKHRQGHETFALEII